jgi:dTDP-4-dehydrorhamnose reductase
MTETTQGQDVLDTPLPIWGGLECTVARIGDVYRDELAETGSLERAGDIAAILDLGISALRYPLLWEHVAPDGLENASWDRQDRELAAIQARGVQVIAGLCHHGSGPRHTSLLDPEFPRHLARYAARVAERYPWIEAYTPVNEPLTTARFACLYGHWYPHKTDEASFLLALFHEIRGTALAMQEIRARVPHARLIQTEDVGRVFSTPRLAYQARYDNARRWLSLDLLCGRVIPTHPWFSKFVAAGVPRDKLTELAARPCPPDIVGVNYYLSSDRYLDEHLAFYPRSSWGGNGRERYADVEAFRVADVAADVGLAQRLTETAERYGLPLAVTELHNGCTREEQLRWLLDGYKDVCDLRRKGLDIRAITPWALMGSVDWNSLLTVKAGHYESGAFDTRDTTVRPTVIARAVKALANGQSFSHPVMDGVGWWRRPERFFPPHGANSPQRSATTQRRLLITGASGTLGAAFARLSLMRGLEHVVTQRAELDIADERSVAQALEKHRPWAVVNAAGYVRVVEAENDRDRCLRENSVGPEVLARSCAQLGIPLLTFSSDLVFNGQLGRGYVETDEPCPAGVYGASKAAAERAVRDAHPHALVVRTSAFFGPWDRYNFVHQTLAQMAQGKQVVASHRKKVSPTYVPDLVNRSLDLLIDGEHGLWHLANEGQLSWADLAALAAAHAGYAPGLVVADDGDPHELNTALSTLKGTMLRPLSAALAHYFAHNEQTWAA